MIKLGDKLPAFSLPDQNGQMTESSSFVGKPVVIYFYPKDDTPGCTAEACSFRDHFEDFKSAGATVVGISNDRIEDHQKFAAKHRLPFTLLSDASGSVRRLFGVPRSFLGLVPGRVTYIFDGAGVLVHSFNSQLRALRHIEESLAIIKKLSASV